METTMTTARMANAATIFPDIAPAVQRLLKPTRESGVPEKTLELVHLRASQINGCSFCVDYGARAAMIVHLDTSVLIDALTGPRRSLDELERLLHDGQRLALSTIVLYEWWRGPRGSRWTLSGGIRFGDPERT